jgi:hypothetical protein
MGRYLHGGLSCNSIIMNPEAPEAAGLAYLLDAGLGQSVTGKVGNSGEPKIVWDRALPSQAGELLFPINMGEGSRQEEWLGWTSYR